jgi:hypothetical protein
MAVLLLYEVLNQDEEIANRKSSRRVRGCLKSQLVGKKALSV